jgi:putative ABC transport system ATP-binding protein
MESTLYRFVLKHSPRETVFLCVLAIAALVPYYLSLDIPKNIFNQAILGKGITFPTAIAGVTNVFGVTFDQIGFLFVLCTFYLVMVLVNGMVKQYINTYKGRLGERLLRRMRYELISRILRFPLPHFRKVSQGELIPMITSEVEPLGGYMGDAFAQPLIQAGTLLTIVVFLFVQNPIMGLAAISLYPLQAYIIPKLQRRVNLLGKERVRAVRKLSERIGESVSGIQEIRANGTLNFERADFSDRLGLIYRIRFEIYQRKSFVKFLNNLMNQMAPLLFYSIGGYLVITGDLTAGALAAALTANKDMSAPWKELLDYYQQTQDAKIKYDQVTEQFRPANMIEESLQQPLDKTPARLEGPIAAANVSLVDDSQYPVLDNVTFTLQPGEKVAIVGPPNGGKEALAMLLARLYLPNAGKLTIGGLDLATLPEAAIGMRIGYAGQSAYLFSCSLRANLAYGLRQRPVAVPERDDTARKKRERWLAESARSGNLALDTEAEWTDFEQAGVSDRDALTQRMIEVLSNVDMGEDIFIFGLRGTVDPKAHPQTAEDILKARAALQKRLADPALQALVETFDPERYNLNATLAENLMFGTAVGPAFDTEGLAENHYVLDVLNKAGLTEDLIAVGRRVAETMVELFADLPPGHEFFEQFSFISAEDLPQFQSLLARTAGNAQMSPDDRTRLLRLPFKLIEARHRLGLIDEKLRARVLEARKMFREGLPDEARSAIAFFDPAAYNAAASIQDNILFGKVAYGQAKAGARVGKLIVETLDELHLRTAVLDVGLEFQAGVGGARLTPTQRQKLALARALLKRPDVLIINEATALLDNGSQGRLMDAVFKEAEGRTLIWVLHNAALAKRFDRVLVFAEGRLAEDAGGADLERPGTLFAELVAAA